MGGGEDMGGHVLRETTSRGLCGPVCPSRTSERGGEGDCVKEGGEEEGKCERERALLQRLCVCVYCVLLLQDLVQRCLHGGGVPCVCVCFITAGPITKLCAWGEEESGGHVL
jgi:hypothetical protein